MDKILPEKPVLIMLYGFPGSGKTYFSRQFCEEFQAAHLEMDRIRQELFEKPSFSKQESYALGKIIEYVVGEFIKAGVSVVCDMNAMRAGQRRALREVAKKNKAKTLLIWFQVDADTAFTRSSSRDKRRLDDRFSASYDVEQFKEQAAYMQQPELSEEPLVISGKYAYTSQRSSVVKRLADMRVVKPTSAVTKMVKPGLVNLVPFSPKSLDKKAKRTVVLR